jgi:ABC-type Zn uptake system ZnuABC Zn-binding protein ZnuA/ABC-type Mn2+/Zn2+ transport system permease subunit
VEELTGPFQLPYVQRGMLEVLLLAAGAGILGCWIVLRSLAFYSHAVGTAAFPGLVLADALGFAAPLGALGAAAAFALLVSALGGRGRAGPDVTTALGLTGMLALGVILASDVFESGPGVESLLFGSLLLVEPRDLALAGAASAAAVGASLVLGRAWLARGFDPAAARALGMRSAAYDAALLGLVAIVVTAALSALGALLVTALVVVPAATVRLWTDRLLRWQAATVGLVAVEGTAGLWLSVQLNAPPGATIAMLAGAAFVVSSAFRALGPRPRRVVAAAAVAASLALAGTACGSDGGSGQERVVATTTQVGDWAKAVGSRFDVHQILRPNTDPHDYEPRPEDVEALAEADVIFRSGGDLDAWVGEAADDAGSEARIVNLGSGLPVERRGGGEEVDPHWWHDPRNAAHAVKRIGAELASRAGERGGRVRAATARYLAAIRALDRGIARCIAPIPREQRKLVTDHDALGYFADRYGLDVVGTVFPARTTVAQPSAGELAELADAVEREGVEAVFPQASVNDDTARAIARETRATVGRELYGDTLGPAGSSGDTYLAMEAANADSIVRGLSGGGRGCKPAAA